MPRNVGVLSQINRYPVKSFAGEQLSSCRIESYGLYGDRFCAFYDDSQSGFARYLTARDIPDMLAYKARLIEGAVTVTSPDGRTFSWNEDLLQEMQQYTKRPMTLSSYKAPHYENPELMSVDQASVLIVADSSLRKLEILWGNRLDARRFRPSLIVAVDDDTVDEADWIGRRLTVGDSVELQVDVHCRRCSMITIDPDSLARDPSLLRKVNEELDLNFGVYASVRTTGLVRAGDTVGLL